MRPALLGSVLLITLACAPGATVEPDLQTLLDQVREEQEAPGAILGVRFPDGRQRIWVSGLADVESGRPMKPGDPFRLGSIAKTITAAVVLQLVEEDRVELEDPLSVYLPDFPHAADVTLRALLRHESGIPDFALYAYLRPDRDEMIGMVTREWALDELLELAASLDAYFDETQEWSYSNSNYFLLGVVIERATGSTLAAELRARIFEPLGMETSWLDWYEPARGALPVTGYLGPVEGWKHSEMFGELGPTTPIDRGNMEWGSGGVIASAGESLRFIAALLDGTLLSEESLASMTDFVDTPPLGGASALSAGDTSNHYGLGISRAVRPAGYSRLGHGGIYNGHQAGLWRFEPCGIDVALFVNRGFVDDRRMTDRIAAALECR